MKNFSPLLVAALSAFAQISAHADSKVAPYGIRCVQSGAAPNQKILSIASTEVAAGKKINVIYNAENYVARAPLDIEITAVGSDGSFALKAIHALYFPGSQTPNIRLKLELTSAPNSSIASAPFEAKVRLDSKDYGLMEETLSCEISVGSQRVTASDTVREKLGQDTWVFALGSGWNSESFSYRFKADGTYVRNIQTDFSAPALTGTWQLTQNAQGQATLRLASTENGACYWLSCGQDIVLAYDPVTDELVVSGGNIVGSQRLYRRK